MQLAKELLCCRDELLGFIEEAVHKKVLSFNHDERLILHIYLYGSRVYFHQDEDLHHHIGSNRDYDTVVIVRSDVFDMLVQNCKKEELENNISVEFEEDMKLELFVLNSNKQYYKILYTFVRNNMEVSMSIYSERIFLRMIQDHSIFILFCVHNRNPIVKLKETWNQEVEGYNTEYPSLSKCYYRKYFQKHKLVPSVLSEVNRAWQKFYNKIVKDHDENKGIKLVVYCFRFLAWANELLKHHCVDESVFCGNDIYWKLRQTLDNFDHKDYKALYQTIFNEYSEEYNLQVDSFTKFSEFASLYPNINLTKLETTEVIIDNASAVLSEMKSLLEGLSNVEDVHNLFSIEYTPIESTGLILNATDMSPRDYPIVRLCTNPSTNSTILLDTENGKYIFKTIPFIPNIRMEMSESACREISLKNTTNEIYHEFYVTRKGQEYFSVWWDYQSLQWKVNCPSNMTKVMGEFIACLPNLLNTGDLTKMENYSIILQVCDSKIDLVGFTCLQNGHFSQKLVKKIEDFGPNLIISNDIFNSKAFTLAFRQPVLKIQQTCVPTFDGYRILVLNHDQIQDILQDNQVQVLEIFSYTPEFCKKETEPFYIFITTPSSYCCRKMKQIILENGDCTLKSVSQIPKHVKDLCLDFARWNLDSTEITHTLISHHFYGNTIDLIFQQTENYRYLISNLVERIKGLSILESNLVESHIRAITTNKQAISLIRAIIVKIQQKPTIDNIIIRCIRNTYRQRLLMLLEEF